MHRNSLNQHILSSLDPNTVFQTHFVPSNVQKFRRPLQRHPVSSRHSIRSGDKKQYLTLVSKDRKPQKRTLLKSSKKNGPKKIHSVILGGEKNTDFSFTNTQKPLKSSLCRSCTSLHQRTQIQTEPTPKYNMVNVQPLVQANPIFIRPQSPIPVQNAKSQQLNRMIFQKLNLVNEPPHQMSMKMDMRIIQSENAAHRFGGKMIRNTSSAGRIYFVGSSVEKKHEDVQQTQRPMSTPRFDKLSPQKQPKSRRNTGFIRSASTPRISYNQSPPSHQQHPSSNQLSSTTKTKQLQIQKCIEKMSSIRKQIDQLQDFLHDRLVTSQLKNKLMYTPSNSFVKNSQPSEQQISFSTIHVDSRLYERESRNTPVNSINLLRTQENDSQCVLTQLKPSSLNSSAVSTRSNNFYSQNQQPTLNFSKIQNLYQMKCPTSNYNTNIEKQIITQIASKHNKFHKENQQNVFYQKRPINLLR